MNAALSYILMYISAVFYCGFDAAIKEKALEHSATAQNSSFKIECEIMECLSKTLKVTNDNGKLTAEGFVTLTGVFSDFNATVMEKAQKQLNRCLPEVNQKLYFLPHDKCTRFQYAGKLLENCVDKKELDLFRA